MSAAPGSVRIKRKRNEPGPDRLVLEADVEPQRKKVLRLEDAAQSKRLQYVKVSNEEDAKERGRVEDTKDVTNEAGLSGQQCKLLAEAIRERTPRRVFHLSKVGPRRLARKNDICDVKQPGIATFEESRLRATKPRGPVRIPASSQDANVSAASHAPIQELKRPGRGATTSGQRLLPHQAVGGRADRKHLETVADDLSKFALEELAVAQKAKVTTLPKYPGRRRNVERPQAGTTEPHVRDDEEMDLDSDGDYVYDTYILAPSNPVTMQDSQLDSEMTDVGVLIITDADQLLWESYLDDELSDGSWDTDEEDENAEDYYGADYPENELASDDEYDRNAYGFRAKAESDEEWDETTGAYSDDENEYERTMNPWKAKTPQQFAARMDGENARVA